LREEAGAEVAGFKEMSLAHFEVKRLQNFEFQSVEALNSASREQAFALKLSNGFFDCAVAWLMKQHCVSPANEQKFFVRASYLASDFVPARCEEVEDRNCLKESHR